MPYIKKELRKQYDDILNVLPVPPSAGELNYVLTRICIKYFRRLDTGNYQAINDIIGVLDCTGKEFYRRIAGNFEDQKMIDNGDVY